MSNKAVNNHRSFLLVPPYLDERVTVAYKSASKEFHKKYALYASVLIGNMQPQTSNDIIDSLSYVFHSSLYKRLKENLMKQAEEIRFSGTSFIFSPSKTVFEPDTGKTFVTGLQKEIPTNGEPKERTVTFEFKLGVNEYVPTINHFDYYVGGPRDAEWKRRNG